MMKNNVMFPALFMALSTGAFGMNNDDVQAMSKDTSWLKPYNVVWDSPSDRAVDSMPCSGGNVALNVWATEDDVLFYIGSSDSWIDGSRPQEVHQVKLGRVRLRLSPNPLRSDFRQELDLAHNSIRISGKAEDGRTVHLRIWVDAFKPIVHVEGEASEPVNVAAALEIWRGDARFDGTSAVWRCRTEGPSRARRAAIAAQDIEPIASSVPDPIANLTFGGRLSGDVFEPNGVGEGTHEGLAFRYWRLNTNEPVYQFHLQAALRIAQDPDVAAWEKSVHALAKDARAKRGEDWKQTVAWWKEFWNRSRIVINPNASKDDPAWQVGRNYQLFRAMLAANRSGRFPTLFNGAAFLCEANPDKRQWGHAGFTAQNQRLVYWPLLKTGDADLMRVAIDFYAGRHELALAWAKHFWGIDGGGVFPEGIDVFGMPVRMARKDGTSKPQCLRYHWTSGMEFALMMLKLGQYTGEDVRRYATVAGGILRFYDQFYRQQHKQHTGKELDDNGHLVIYPGNALEVYSGTRNDSAALAGLMALIDGLLALPEGAISEEDRQYYAAFRGRLAPIATHIRNDHRCIAPAEAWDAKRLDFNMELPQLYPVFPFRFYGVGRPDLELARNTWQYGFTDAAKQKGHFCWYQGGIFTACLGLTGETKQYALARFLHPAWPVPDAGTVDRRGKSPWKLHWLETPGWKVPRYPAFWDCMMFDARPDMDHGGAGMIQLQEMLLQTAGERILLLPAWPKEWDADFRLHAPHQTTVEGSVRGGKLVSWNVTPAHRKKDVHIAGPRND